MQTYDCFKKKCVANIDIGFFHLVKHPNIDVWLVKLVEHQKYKLIIGSRGDASQI
jgi:hypothetical protein